MTRFIQQLSRRQFEARIFISLMIVLIVCIVSYGLMRPSIPNGMFLGMLIGLDEAHAGQISFLVAAVVMVLASALRMWSGTVLSSDRVMAFPVQDDALLRTGPYRIVRNPIYLSDIIAMCGFALCLPPAGLLLPVLFFIHYYGLVRYEERSLMGRLGDKYEEYQRQTPRILPNHRSMVNIGDALNEFQVNRDGLRNNALYVLFIPGFFVAALTGEFFYAVLIGLPGVFDWSVIHTRKGLSKNKGSNGRAQPSRGKRKKVFDDVLYAQCWEDPQIDRRALNIGQDDIVFTITSGGCNALTFLLDDPRKIIALDLNPYQNYVLELKIAAFKTLRHGEMLEFLGVRDSRSRLLLYERVRASLGPSARTYWDGQRERITSGVIHCGRYEGYLRLLRTWLWRIYGKDRIAAFFEEEDSAKRTVLYKKKWKGASWWVFTRILLSRSIMTLLFDKAFFQYLDRSFSFGKHFAGRVEHALTQLPMKENYFLSYILLGRFYSEQYLPVYLREEYFKTIRDRVQRIDIVCESCENFFEKLPDSSIAKFNFSNIFEWIAPEAFHKLLREIVRVGKNGSVIVYRNLLVFRERPDTFAEKVESQKELAHELHLEDLSFIYNNYVVETIKKETQWSTESQPSMIEER